jgi:hypothetical protein
MKTDDRKNYETPAVQVVELNSEGVICQSGVAELPGWGNETELD